VDDFDLFRFPASSGSYSSDEFPHLRYQYDLDFAKFIIAPLGVPWHKSKGQDFASRFLYLGFSWDLVQRSVSLTNEKRAKHIYRVQTLLSAAAAHKATLKLVQTVAGSLTHTPETGVDFRFPFTVSQCKPVFIEASSTTTSQTRVEEMSFISAHLTTTTFSTSTVSL
jgi:hypothetical protein